MLDCSLIVDKYAASRFLSAVQLLSYQNNLNYALQQCGLEKVGSQALNKVQCMEYKLRAQIGQIYFYMDLGVVWQFVYSWVMAQTK